MKVFRIRMTDVTDRVVMLRQLKISELHKLQISVARAIGEEENPTQLEIHQREGLEGVKASLCGVTSLPVDIWRPTEPPDEPDPALEGKVKQAAQRLYEQACRTWEANEEQRPKDGHEVRDGRLVIEEKGPDGLGNLQPGDFVRVNVKDLEMPGPLELDNLLDPREYSCVVNAWRQTVGAPPRLVTEMLAGKLKPVVMEG